MQPKYLRLVTDYDAERKRRAVQEANLRDALVALAITVRRQGEDLERLKLRVRGLTRPSRAR